jgi:Zn-dependent oligopeptidase
MEDLKKLKEKLSKLKIEYTNNVFEDKTKLTFKKEELEGLEDDFLNNLEKDETGYKISLKYPEYVPCMENVKCEDTRKLLEYAKNSQCVDKNVKIIEEIFQLRSGNVHPLKKEIAQTLGYKNHSEYQLENKMAKNSENVMNFLNEMKEKLQEKGKEELNILINLKNENRKEQSDNKINSWDTAFYINLYKKLKFNVDENKIKEYFPFDKVIEGFH